MSASRNAYSHLANGGERVSVQNGDWYARAEIILTSKGGAYKIFLERIKRVETLLRI